MSALLEFGRDWLQPAEWSPAALLLTKATCLLAVAWLVHFGLSRTNPRWRVLLWRGATVSLLALAALALAPPALEMRVLQPEPLLRRSTAITGTPKTSPADHAPRQPELVRGLPDAPWATPAAANVERAAPKPMSRATTLEPVAWRIESPKAWQASLFGSRWTLLVAWLSGTLLLAARLALGYRVVGRIVAGAGRVPEWVTDEGSRVAAALGCHRVIEFRQSGQISTPFLCGLWRTWLLLPTRMCQPGYRAELPAIMAHELAHARSNDLRWNAVLRACSAAIWFHPLVWRLPVAHATACEAVGDAVSATLLGDARDYCRTLAKVALELTAAPPAAGVAMARTADVSRRLRALQQHVFSSPLCRRRVALSGFAGLLAVALVGGLRFTYAQPPAEAKAAKAVKPPPKPAVTPPAAEAAQGMQRMRVRVVDEREKPIVGAIVTTQVNGLGATASHTDGDGSLAIDVAKEGFKNVVFRVNARGFAYKREGSRELRADRIIIIGLKPGVMVGGTVRNEEGGPIEGAVVNLNYEAIVTTTNARGRWLAGLEEGKHVGAIRLYHPEYVCSSLWEPVPSELDLLAETSVKVMKRGLALKGAVHDREGRPVAGALVLSQPYNVDMDDPDSDFTTTRTRADGTFEFHNIPPGKGKWAVYAESFGPRVVPIDAQPHMPAVEIELGPAGELNGQVVDDKGNPVPDVSLSINEWDWDQEFPLDRELQAVTNARGSFQLDHLPREGTLTVTCWENQGEESEPSYATTEFKGVRSRSEPYRFTLARPTVIAGDVLDAKTGEPITRFELNHDAKWPGEEDFTFSARPGQVVDDGGGRFRWTLTSQSSPPDLEHMLRVNARGYLAADTPAVKAGGQVDSIVFRLERAEPITGIVIDPDGEPAREAQVAWVGPKRTAFIEHGRFSTNSLSYTYSPEYVVETGADGRFELPPSRDAGLIVALLASGYAIRPSTEHQPDAKVVLTRWCRVEGVVRQGRDPLFEAYVCLLPVDPKMRGTGSPISWGLNQRTGSDGRIAFDHVPAVPLTAAWYAHGLASHRVTFEPQAGETAKIEIGGKGAAVVGKLKKPDGLALDTFTDEFELGMNCTQVVAFPVEDADKKPETRSNFLARLKPDGAFRVDDLPPGKYILAVNVHAPVPPDSCGLPVVVAHARTNFEITKTNGDQPLELGTFRLTYAPGPQPGQSVPDLKGKTLAGADFSLADLRGKLVLLDFWATWCGPCKEATPRLKELYEKYGRDGRLTFVGVDIDNTSEMARAYVKEHEVPWVQVTAGAWGEDNPLLQAFTVTSVPSFWLIGADGTILARDVPLAELEAAIVKALNGSKD